MMKLKNLNEQIEERYNKLYFIPKKKVNPCYQNVLKKKKKNDNDSGKYKAPLFTDFMYDVLESKKKE